MTAPRLMDRPLKRRLLFMLPLIVGLAAGLVPIPLAMHLAGLPLRLADSSAPFFAAIVGSQFALDTRPSGARHLILLSLTVFAMVAVCHLVYVLIHLAIAPEGDAAGVAWLGLRVLSICGGIGAAAGAWFLIARLTRTESLWEKSDGDVAVRNLAKPPPRA